MARSDDMMDIEDDSDNNEEDEDDFNEILHKIN